MPNQIKRINLFIKEDDKSRLIAKDLTKILLANNYIIDCNEYDLAISIGGDGTFLKMIHETNFNNDVFYCGINAGNLGFLSDIEYKSILRFISHLNNSEYHIDNINYLNVVITIDDRIIEYKVMNEILIKNSDYSVLHIPVYIDNVLLEDFHGDGLLISTPIGSTAHNLSFNGPIIDYTLNVVIITPMAPINNKKFKSLTNSMVVANNKSIVMIPKINQNITFIIDGNIINIDSSTKIELQLSSSKLKFLHMPEYENITQINNKILQ